VAKKKEKGSGGGPRIGVYVCHCGVNIAATVDVAKVVEYAASLPGVVIARDYAYVCSDPGQKLILEDIRTLGIDRVVTATCSPRLHEATFRKTLQEAGLNPYCLDIANIREHCSWVHADIAEGTEKAKRLVASAIARSNLLQPLEEKEVPVIAEALVIGGGISGIQAALDIADAGFTVHLVERQPSIGGHMAQLDKTFPTLDCSACILTPKMVQVERHPNIRLYAYSEVEDVQGFVGNFSARIRRKATFVDWDTCNACDDCTASCPVKVPDEFNMGLSQRGAIYRPFPQAVPNKFVIQKDVCIECKKCQKVCQPEAIDFEMEDEIVEVKVGTIVVATGYDQFNASLKPEFGYDQYDNVITGLEFERLVSPSGPTAGKVLVDGQEPQKVVFVHCVGSRDETVGNEYCSRVCCMATAKQAHLIREKLPDADITVLYMDVRAFGKGFEEFYLRVKEEGISYRRANPSEIYRKDGRLAVRAEDTLVGETVEIMADLVVLAAGMVPNASTPPVANMLRLGRSADGFLMEAHPKLRPVETAIDGIYLAGCCQSPKDIPDAVAQAKGAAASAIAPMSRGTVAVEPITAVIDEDLCSGCRTCEAVCEYSALNFDEEKGTMRVNDALCKGCGACGATCPSGCISLRHYTDRQILAQIGAILTDVS
jgi:heterodisulfide reductase subunit A